jgi:ribosomal protein L16/L10AE
VCLVTKKKSFLRRLLRSRASSSSSVYGLLPLGAFGVVSLEAGLLTQNQREAVRKVLARRLKPVGGRY